jgi:hypothetical protein
MLSTICIASLHIYTLVGVICPFIAVRLYGINEGQNMILGAGLTILETVV